MARENIRRNRRYRRRRRNIKRIRQRNGNVFLMLLLICFVIWVVIVNTNKENEKKEAAVKTTVREEQKGEEKGQLNEGTAVEGLKVASKEEKQQWYLKLVNKKNPMQQADVPEVTEIPSDIGEGYYIDTRILPELEQMFRDARAAGRNPMICSAFREWEQQVFLHENKIQRVMISEGLDRESAEAKASTVVARPGTSEHQVGLALDIVSSAYAELDEDQMKTEDQKWLIANSWKYGFILRYPLDKSDITGVIFEPWHYRYVGKQAAKEITEQGITLEEYLGAEPVKSPAS